MQDADDYYPSHTVQPDFAARFQSTAQRERIAGTKLQVFPLSSIESDYGAALPLPKASVPAPDHVLLRGSDSAVGTQTVMHTFPGST